MNQNVRLSVPLFDNRPTMPLDASHLSRLFIMHS